MTLHFKSITEIAEMLRDGSTTCVELTDYMLDRIDWIGPQLNAFITVTHAAAKNRARIADQELRDGTDLGPLHGIPFAVKDIFATAGTRTTSGSLLFKDWIPDFEATAVQKLRDAGAVIVGKTGMSELAAGTTGHNPFFGDIKNPWKNDHDPGGSSGGSASAVAAGLAFAALGTDTGCSVREPAHCCGIVGLKPTFGRVSKAGVQPLIWSMDHVGILARQARDISIVFDAIVGPDRDDPYSDGSGSRSNLPRQEIVLSDARVGVVRRFFFDCEPEIIQAVDKSISRMRQKGATVIELDLPDIEDAFAAIRVTFAEAAAVHQSDLEKQPGKFSEQVRKALLNRLATEATDYINAQHFRAGFKKQVDAMFSQVDFLVAPTSRHVAAHLSDLPENYRDNVWKNTSIFNFTGHPSVSIPIGFSEDGLPVGMMITGSRYADHELLQFAETVMIATGWQNSSPGTLEERCSS